MSHLSSVTFKSIVAFAVFVTVYFVSYKYGTLDESKTAQEKNEPAMRMLYEDVQHLDQKTAIKEKLHVTHPDLPIPTNRWFSSVAFTKTSDPIFAYPLAIKMNDNGFGVSYPKVVSTPDTVFGSYNPDIQVVFKEKNLEALVDSYDDLSVGIAQKSQMDTVSTIRITHGSPYVFALISPQQSFDIVSDDFRVVTVDDVSIVFTARGKSFAFFFSPNEVSVDSQNGKGLSVSVLEKEAHVSIAVLPDGYSDANIFKRYAFDPIVRTKVTSDVNDDIARSHFEITTQNNQETLLALLPKSKTVLDNAQPSLGTYQTLRGEQTLYSGKSFDFSRKVSLPPQQLPIGILSDTDKDTLRSFVREDVKDISIKEEDTYFLGKKLFALANVLDIAEQLSMNDESEILKTEIRNELELWRTNTVSQNVQKKYFYYDPIIKGIVGETASFGSDIFNDHNFHYGYFIYAASILSRYDPDYRVNNESFINLLVKDIANIDCSDDSFPYIRGFDAYQGHSFASGNGLFADGNNQESSSEAVNAWYAVYLWSSVIGNKALRDTSLYLYSEESSSALTDWLNIEKSDTRFANFKHAFVSLVWGGKLDAATWFSDRPEAKLGIQIIPVSPASLYLGQDRRRVAQNMLSEKELQNPTMFKDYLAMYSALYDPDGSKQKIDALKTEDIDSANSKSFMTAWVLTLKRQSH